ncbi:MAG: class 1 fructose-bisphosphatase [Campylobacterales bacterium]
MNEIFEAIKRSAFRIQEAIAYDDTGYADNQNASGDAQLKVDIKSDLIIEEELAKVPSVKAISSEEREHEDLLNENGTYLVAYDPLDGSSLIDVNLSVGSIFGIYKERFSGPTLLAAAYVVYGPRIELVIAHERVELYRLNKRNEFVFIQDIRLHEKGKLNATGGTQQHWPANHKVLIESLFQEGYRLRYSGGMVPDLHQILIKGGGLFSYPGTTDKPEGKLRQIYEVLPFALIYEMAGGEAIDGYRRLLDLDPRHHHDTTPCYFGSRYEIAKVRQIYA